MVHRGPGKTDLAAKEMAAAGLAASDHYLNMQVQSEDGNTQAIILYQDTWVNGENTGSSDPVHAAIYTRDVPKIGGFSRKASFTLDYPYDAVVNDTYDDLVIVFSENPDEISQVKLSDGTEIEIDSTRPFVFISPDRDFTMYKSDGSIVTNDVIHSYRHR